MTKKAYSDAHMARLDFFDSSFLKIESYYF